MTGLGRRQFLAVTGLATVWAGLLASGYRASAELLGATVTETIGAVKGKKAPQPKTVVGGNEPATPGAPPPSATDVVQKGYAIEAGTTITTAAKSAAEIQMPDGSDFTIGARSAAILGGTKGSAYLDSGKYRFKSGPNVSDQALTTATVTLSFKDAEFVVAVHDNASVWLGVRSGSVTMTSNRKGTMVAVAAGQSAAWTSGSFGKGMAHGVFTTEDLAVDEGLDKARLTWEPPTTPPPAIAPPAVHPQPTPGSISGVTQPPPAPPPPP